MNNQIILYLFTHQSKTVESSLEVCRRIFVFNEFLVKMDVNAFQCNADLIGIVESCLNGSITSFEMYSQVQEAFSTHRFECPDLERAVRDENHYASQVVDERPPVADDKEFLDRWFEVFGKLSRGARFLLKELQGRKQAFNEKKLQYLASQEIDYQTALKELYDAGLIEKPLNEKLSPPLSSFALDGMSFKGWHDRLIEIYLNTLCLFTQANRFLISLPEKWEKGIVIGVKVLAAYVEICEDCLGFLKGKEYIGAEIEKLPRLPLHWGCKCSYIPITKFSA